MNWERRNEEFDSPLFVRRVDDDKLTLALIDLYVM